MVDDDEEDRMLLKDTFDDLGYGQSIHFEENGERAIQYLNECMADQCLPCLVILDLNMPRLNGRQTLKYIKNEPALHNISVIIYSTSLNPVERDECLALGAHSYEIKPISHKDSLRIAEKFYSMCGRNPRTTVDGPQHIV
jgi:two-component system response regulator